MKYEVWEQTAGNLVGVYPTLEAALGVVRDSVKAHGDGYAATWLLASADEAGEGDLIAGGTELVTMACGPHQGRSRLPA
jgi:hypothetical protein